jgi:transcriptional regulator GlxA family with amidase domain
MNVTPVQYLTEYRVDLAETMLKNTGNSVSDIAWKCGFEDESYFSRCYKKIKGISPNALRRKIEIKKE